jgi:hypothetical protein
MHYDFTFIELLDPDDKRLKFITEREREESSHIRQPLKHIAIFRTPRGDHFVCYDGNKKKKS